MPTRDIIVMGASAGGLQALIPIVSTLPPDLAASVFIVQHIPPYAPSLLPQILTRVGHLPVQFGVDGEPVRHGRIYVAPPDYHLLLEPEQVRLTYGPKENRARPAIDPLFRSAATAFGPRVIGVVLSGAFHDGAAGLGVIKAQGGIAVVQHPAEAQHPDMPRSAKARVAIDYCLPVAAIASLLVELTQPDPT